MKHPARTKTANVPTKTGGKYSYSYADLADVIDATRKAFSEFGLAIIQTASYDGGLVSVSTRIIHSSGQWIEGILSMPCADTKPQTIGSAITYARRYSISPMAGIASDDDDDASLAQGVTAEITQRTRPVTGGGSVSRPAQETKGPTMQERVEKMLSSFQAIGIPPEEVQQELGKPLEECTDADLKDLAVKYKDLKSIFDANNANAGNPATVAEKLEADLKGKGRKR